MSDKSTKVWLKSKEVEKALKIDSCHLMHLRIEGKLKHKKEGRAFFYLSNDVEKLMK